ncbi:MAG: hypothetical protein JWR04_20 [Rhodoglobus sp.]|nr:hypothetical protein [Rhodoglobus sp.]
MARTAPARKLSARPLLKAGAAVAGIAIVAGLAVVAQGYDAQEVPRLETSVWVTRDDGQYARVNTELGELDTVRSVQDPTSVVQSGSRSLVFSQGYSQLWPVDAASPVNLSEGATAADGSGEPATSSNTPAGTRVVVSAGGYILYLTDTGSVFLGVLDDSGVAPDVAIPVNPFGTVVVAEGEERPTYVASAVAVSEDGQVVLYSAAESSIRRFDAKKLEFVGGATKVAVPPKAESALELAIVGSKWVMSAPAEGLVWVDGQEKPFETGLNGDAKLQSSAPTGQAAYLADSEGLASVDLGTGAVSSVTAAAGIPATPIAVEGTVYAAWLSADSGTLWSSATGESIALETESDVLDDVQSIAPVFRSNGQRLVLNETSSGMVWTVPDGALIPVDQWSVGDDTQQDTGTVLVDDVAEEKPPVAVADSLGVRQGAQVALPLLLNDHDPNKKDVLSIAADSIAGGLADPSFGTLGLASNNQQAVVKIAAESGSTTFIYSVTDGAAVSDPAPVTLTVVPPDQNSAPVWCGVDDCKQEWPSPQISPGGTVTIPVLTGWVDPEGDPFVLSDARAENDSDPVSVVATADGRIAVRHSDPNASSSAIPIVVTVTDSFGASAEKVLTLVVSASPALDVAPIALVAGAGEKATIRINEHVTGGSGAYRVLDAVASTSSSSGLLVVPNAAAGTVELTASSPGEYLVNYSVQDATTLSQQSAIIRLTVPEAGVPLSIAPVTAFVRSNEDTTIDLVGAVQNSTGRVLIVSQAATSDPGLSVSVVGQSQVRVSGSTPTGEPGKVGTATVTVTDGAGATVEGQLTVFQVPASTDSFPIAVPDSVTVRAGGQVDIPVLANDLSPRGERLVLHPQVDGSGTPGELTFVAGDAVRYLAPTVPGVYLLRYSIYLESRPDRVDTATISVTVLPGGANRAPQPSILTARALSGQTVRIPVSGFGVDPDGDSVILASIDQPGAGKGVAAISAEGDAILYTAPAAGVQGGQVSFAYSVRDTQGSEGSALVRVGVLSDSLSDTTPVTYSDYVRTTTTAPNPVTVTPLINDRDPAQGSLAIISLVPNAPAGTEEYKRLEALIDPTTSLADGTVVLKAGSVLGTQSYVYAVQSSISTSTAEGLIVVNVSDVAAPDFPVVADTVVTARTRLELATTGLDVVTGKVQWPSGDVSKLKLDIWSGAGAGFTVSGSTIKGDLPAGGALVPFSLTGLDSAGGTVTSYGFLRIPAFDDMRVQVRTSADPVEVNEEKSVEFTLRDLLDIDRTDAIQIREDDAFTVQRANASCTPSGSSRAVYNAGREAPWVDSCTIPVRIDGQSSWTMVSVPIDILPKDPQAILNSVSRTISPGATESVDLYENMTTWEGGRVGDTKSLKYTTSGGGSAFIVTQTGTTVSIDTRADAQPGTRSTIQVSTDAYGGLSAAITLIVGVAPPDAPRGANFNSQCDVSKGGSCSISVVGITGEYDPFAGKAGSGLKLVSVGSGAPVSCPVATVSVSSPTQVVATWPSGPKPVGGECTVPFTVSDAQGRTGSGQLSIDVLGYPQTPASVVTEAYTGTTVTMYVDLGSAQQAHPSVTGAQLFENGSKVSDCTVAPPTGYRCKVTGLENGALHNYTAQAVNSVGNSGDTTAATTNAYQPPEITSITTAAKYVASTTSTTEGVTTVTIIGGTDVQSGRVLNTGETIPAGQAKDIKLGVGGQTLQIVPISKFTPPLSGSNEGSTTSKSITVVGGPFYPGGGTVDRTADGTRTITVPALDMNYSTGTKTELFIASQSPGVSCIGNAGSISYSGGSNVITSASAAVSGLEANKLYWLSACGSNDFGVAHSNEIQTDTVVMPAQPAGPLTYGVDPGQGQGGGDWEWDNVIHTNAPGAPSGFKLRYSIDGATSNSFPSLNPNVVPGFIGVAYCSTIVAGACTAETQYTYDPALLPTGLTVDFDSCAAWPNPANPTFSTAISSTDYAIVTTFDPGLFGINDRVQYDITFSGAWGTIPAQSTKVPAC